MVWMKYNILSYEEIKAIMVGWCYVLKEKKLFEEFKELKRKVRNDEDLCNIIDIFLGNSPKEPREEAALASLEEALNKIRNYLDSKGYNK